MHIKDPACNQILFCASGSAQYMRTLKKHISFAKKITLVQRGSEDTSLTNLGLRSVTLPQIFESFGGNEADSNDLKETRNGFEVSNLTAIHAPHTIYGKLLIYRQSEQSENYASPMSSVTGSSQRGASKATVSWIHMPPAPTVSLPRNSASEIILINASGDRIDKHMDAPTKAQWNEYNACITTRRLCAMFHVGHGCSLRLCRYDHGQISANERHCLRYRMRALPCRNAGSCRDAFCMRGHMCHYKECKKRRVSYCKMPSSHHGIDPNVKDWITPNENFGGEQHHEGPDPNGGAAEAMLIEF